MFRDCVCGGVLYSTASTPATAIASASATANTHDISGDFFRSLLCYHMQHLTLTQHLVEKKTAATAAAATTTASMAATITYT